MPATTLDVIVQMNIQAAKSELMKLSKIVNMMNQNVLDQNTDVGKYKKLQKAASNYNSVVEDLGKNHPISQQARAEMDGFIKQLKITNGETTKLLHNNKKFKFDFLTLLFVGMMLTKTFGGMFRNIIDSYKKITGLHSVFNKSLLKLQAGFGYLKFAIVNALNSPGIIKAIEWFTNAIVWLGDYLSEHPGLAKAILAVIAALVTVGTLASIASGIIQLDMLLGIMGTSSAGVAISNLSKLSNIVGIGIGLTLSYSGIKDMIKDGLDFKNILFTSIGGALIGYNWFKLAKYSTGLSASAGLTIGIATASILVSFNLIYNHIDKVMEQDPGIKRAGNLLLTSLGAMVSGALAGAAIGSFIPGVGSVIGGLIGFIVAGVGVIFKLSAYDVSYEDPNKSITDEISNTEQGMQYINNSMAESLKIPTDISQELSNYIEVAKNSTTEYDSTVQDLTSSINIMNIDGATMLANQEGMNTLVTDANSLLPIYTTNLEINSDRLLKQAEATNKAASAQERLNKAMANKKSSSSSSSNSSSYSSTTKTSSLYDRYFSN